MKKKYWYKIDFSKASKSLAAKNNVNFHFWEHFLYSSSPIKYSSKSNNKHSILFSSPKNNLQFPEGESEATKQKLSKLKFNFGKFTAIFKGKNLNKNFKKVKSLEIFNSKLGKITYQFNKVISGDPYNLMDPDKNNIVIGSKYNDELEGDGGQNIIYGLGGNDDIEVSGTKNIVYGGKGKDILDVRGGSHKLYGGKGKDIFKLGSAKNVLIADFKDKQDKILIDSSGKYKLKNKGKNVYIYLENDLLARVKGAKGLLSKKGKYLV